MELCKETIKKEKLSNIIFYQVIQFFKLSIKALHAQKKLKSTSFLKNKEVNDLKNQ